MNVLQKLQEDLILHAAEPGLDRHEFACRQYKRDVGSVVLGALQKHNDDDGIHYSAALNAIGMALGFLLMATKEEGRADVAGQVLGQAMEFARRSNEAVLKGKI